MTQDNWKKNFKNGHVTIIRLIQLDTPLVIECFPFLMLFLFKDRIYFKLIFLIEETLFFCSRVALMCNFNITCDVQSRVAFLQWQHVMKYKCFLFNYWYLIRKI